MGSNFTEDSQTHRFNGDAIRTKLRSIDQLLGQSQGELDLGAESGEEKSFLSLYDSTNTFDFPMARALQQHDGVLEKIFQLQTPSACSDGKCKHTAIDACCEITNVSMQLPCIVKKVSPENQKQPQTKIRKQLPPPTPPLHNPESEESPRERRAKRSPKVNQTQGKLRSTKDLGSTGSNRSEGSLKQMKRFSQRDLYSLAHPRRTKELPKVMPDNRNSTPPRLSTKHTSHHHQHTKKPKCDSDCMDILTTPISSASVTSYNTINPRKERSKSHERTRRDQSRSNSRGRRPTQGSQAGSRVRSGSQSRMQRYSKETSLSRSSHSLNSSCSYHRTHIGSTRAHRDNNAIRSSSASPQIQAKRLRSISGHDGGRDNRPSLIRTESTRRVRSSRRLSESSSNLGRLTSHRPQSVIPVSRTCFQ